MAGIKHVVASRDQQEEQRRSTYDDLPWSHPISLLASSTLAEKGVRSISAIRPLTGWRNQHLIEPPIGSGLYVGDMATVLKCFIKAELEAVFALLRYEAKPDSPRSPPRHGRRLARS